MSDIGLNRYLSRVYATTGISLTITLAAALAGTYIPNLTDIAEGATITSGILSFLALKMAYNIKPIRLTYEQEGQTIFKTKNTLTRLITNAFGCVCLGLSGSSLFLSLN
jgi:FtsH-binding integral membrane protein